MQDPEVMKIFEENIFFILQYDLIILLVLGYYIAYVLTLPCVSRCFEGCSKFEKPNDLYRQSNSV